MFVKSCIYTINRLFLHFVWVLVLLSSVNSDIVKNQRDKQYKMMKKHYEKMCMTPLGFEFEGNLLEASVITNSSVVRATGHEVGYTFDGTDTGGGEFNLDWE